MVILEECGRIYLHLAFGYAKNFLNASLPLKRISFSEGATQNVGPSCDSMHTVSMLKSNVLLTEF